MISVRSVYHGLPRLCSSGTDRAVYMRHVTTKADVSRAPSNAYDMNDKSRVCGICSSENGCTGLDAACQVKFSWYMSFSLTRYVP